MRERIANTKYEARIAQCLHDHFGQALSELTPNNLQCEAALSPESVVAVHRFP
jgi:signal transduction histidine kinase